MPACNSGLQDMALLRAQSHLCMLAPSTLHFFTLYAPQIFPLLPMDNALRPAKLACVCKIVLALVTFIWPWKLRWLIHRYSDSDWRRGPSGTRKCQSFLCSGLNTFSTKYLLPCFLLRKHSHLSSGEFKNTASNIYANKLHYRSEDREGEHKLRLNSQRATVCSKLI